jgi:hypothetical protein
MGTEALSSEIKRTGREINKLFPSRAEVKNEWSYTSAPPAYLHGVNKDNYVFYTHVLMFNKYFLKFYHGSTDS